LALSVAYYPAALNAIELVWGAKAPRSGPKQRADQGCENQTNSCANVIKFNALVTGGWAIYCKTVRVILSALGAK
jgi:hypothetical protein